MLVPVEIVDGGVRTSMRRAVSVPCSVFSDLWDVPVEHVLSDLSPFGAFVATSLPLCEDDEIELVFRAPRSDALFSVRARVARVAMPRRRRDTRVPGMGLEFLDLDGSDRAALAAMLEGIPPRLPSTPRTAPARSMVARPSRAPSSELVWVDALLTWEEDLGDRVNVFEVSECVAVDLDALSFEAIGPMLTAARPRYVFSSELA